MSEESEVLKQVLKHKGFFDYSDLYTFCYNWFKDEGYNITEGVYEEKFSGAKEIKIEWEAWKKVTDYLKFVIKVNWHILNMSDAEVEIEGKKKKMNKGDLKMTIKAIMVRDYEKNWEKKPGWKMLRGVYDRYIIRTTIDEYEDRLFGKAESFIEDAKAYLNLEGRR